MLGGTAGMADKRYKQLNIGEIINIWTGTFQVRLHSKWTTIEALEGCGNVHITFLRTFGKDYSGVPGRFSLLENDFFTNRPIASRMDWEAETREEWINDSIEREQLDMMLHWTEELQVARHHSGSLPATRNVDSHISKTDYSSASRTLLSAVCSSITFESCVLLFIFSFWRSFSILSKGSDWIYSSRDCIVLCAQCKRDGLFGSVLIICFVSAFVRREDRDERSEFCKFCSFCKLCEPNT